MPRHCPNCNRPLATGINLCPYCGANSKPQPETTPSFSGSPLLDFILGFAAAAGSLLAWGIGIFIVFVLAAYYREKSPRFFGGVSAAMIVIVLLFLGLLYSCMRTPF